MVDAHVFTYAPGGAIWQYNQGLVADLQFTPVLRMVDDGFRESPSRTKSELDELLARIGAHMAMALQQNDADYFRRLAVVLKARKDGRTLSSLTRSELLLYSRA